MKFCNRLCNYNINQFFSFLNFKKNVVLDELVPDDIMRTVCEK